MDIILTLEKPKTFKVKSSLLFLIDMKNHMEATKIINGINFIKIKLGMYDNVNIKGKNKLSPEFLKNSTSSNKFKIKPKQKAAKIIFKTTFE